jgi:tRNA A-37 threonylcarbamoyl transferase component Bud32
MANAASFLVSLGRNPAPFDFRLGTQSDSTLHGCRVVRALPDKRLVCEARWRNRDVFAKLYFGAGHRRYWRRELAGLRALSDRNILCPEIVEAGPVGENEAHFVLLKSIRPAQSLHSAWNGARDDGNRSHLLDTVVGILARLHQGGLEQRDPHLDNFLFSGERLYTLDGGAISIHPRALSSERSVDNLGLLLATLGPDHDHLFGEALDRYCAHRGWSTAALAPTLAKALDRRRRKRLARQLNKIFRDCSDYACHRSLTRLSVCRRGRASPALQQLLADPDASLRTPSARMLKDGNTCTVWSVPVDGNILVVKRYNIKGFSHRLDRAWRGTRAAGSWRNAHRLQHYAIATPTPVALIEERLGPLRGRAYFITDAVAGGNTLDYFHDRELLTVEDQTLIDAVSRLLAQLGRYRISHGDLKGSNIILGPDGPTLIDLDALREHRWRLPFQRNQRGDIRRFQANWKNRPELRRRFAEALRNLGVPVES